MARPVPHVFVGGPGKKAFASQVNANFDFLGGVFTEGAGGIGDADISANAGIKGTKLSNVPGSRLPNDRFEDDVVDARVLKDDASVDANRAVTTNHIRDAAVTAAKLGTNAVVNAKIKFAEFSAAAATLFGTATLGANSTRYASTALDKTTLRIVGVYIESAGALPAGADQAAAPDLKVFTRGADNLVYLALTNPRAVGLALADYTVKMVYVQNS